MVILSTSSQVLDYVIVLLCVVGFTPLYLARQQNPFGENIMFPKKISNLGIEERKILTFLAKDPKVKRIYYMISVFISLYILAAAGIHIIKSGKFYLFPYDNSKLVPFVFGFLFAAITRLTQSMVVDHYIIKHYEEIINSDIPPWPEDKPFAKDLFGRPKVRGAKSDEPTLIGYLFENANRQFSWSDFLLYSGTILAFVLMFVNFGFVFDFLRGSWTSSDRNKLLYFIFGAVLLIGCQIFWSTRKGKEIQ